LGVPLTLRRKTVSSRTPGPRAGTEEACEAALVQQRWGTGFVCDRCNMRWRGGFAAMMCCISNAVPVAGNRVCVFAHSRLPLRKRFLAIYLVQSKTNLAALELMRHLNVCYRTAWRLKHKLLKAMENAEEGRRLDGFIQIDAAYLGGELNGGTAGRGSENKVPIVVAVSTTEDDKPWHVVASRVTGFINQTIRDWAQARLSPECDVCSDGRPCVGSAPSSATSSAVSMAAITPCDSQNIANTT